MSRFGRDDQIKDRGNIKWTTMMLPQHKQMLRSLWDEQDQQQKPELTEERWEELAYVIEEAMQARRPIQLLYFVDKRPQQVTGFVKKIDPIGALLTLEEENGASRSISIDQLSDVVIIG